MKVLIVKLGALGDIVMATPFIRHIQDSVPSDTDIWLLTSPTFVPLFDGWAGLRVKAFPRKGGLAFVTTVRWMRSMRFDTVYDLQSNDRSALMLSLSGIPCRIGNLTHFPYTHHPAGVYRGEISIFERMNQVMSCAGLAPAEARPWLPLAEEGRRRVVAWLAARGLSHVPFVVMHAFASPKWQSKCWPYFGQLALMLEQRGLRVVWIGAGSDAAGNAALAAEVGIDATNQFSVNELAELGRYARFAVTNDSGPMHVLSCSDIPVYAFFGPTNLVQSHAIGQSRRTLTYAVSCSPCHLPVCLPEKHHACLKLLTAQSVLDRLIADGLVQAM